MLRSTYVDPWLPEVVRCTLEFEPNLHAPAELSTNRSVFCVLACFLRDRTRGITRPRCRTHARHHHPVKQFKLHCFPQIHLVTSIVWQLLSRVSRRSMPPRAPPGMPARGRVLRHEGDPARRYLGMGLPRGEPGLAREPASARDVVRSAKLRCKCSVLEL